MHETLEYHREAARDELSEGHVTTVTVGTKTLVLTHFERRYATLDDPCPHEGGPLGERSIENGGLRCPWRGWDFHSCTARLPGAFEDSLETFRDEECDEGIYPRRHPRKEAARPQALGRHGGHARERGRSRRAQHRHLDPPARASRSRRRGLSPTTGPCEHREVMTMRTERQLVALAVSVGLAFGAAALGALATTPNIEGWYAGLAKPGWTPPNAVFGPVWTALYLLMAFAAWWVWRHGREGGRRRALALYAAQLALNALWSPVFFGAHQLLGGLVVIAVLLAVLLLTVLAFFRTAPLAGALLLPYLLWVAYATALNAAIWRLNA